MLVNDHRDKPGGLTLTDGWGRSVSNRAYAHLTHRRVGVLTDALRRDQAHRSEGRRDSDVENFTPPTFSGSNLLRSVGKVRRNRCPSRVPHTRSALPGAAGAHLNRRSSTLDRKEQGAFLPQHTAVGFLRGNYEPSSNSLT